MSGRVARLAAEVVNKPMLMEPSAASYWAAVISQRMGAQAFHFAGQEIDSEEHAESFQSKARFAGGEYRHYLTHDNGVAQISIDGSLVHRFGYLDSRSGMTGYDGIREKLERAADDKAVKGIMLDIDSPGGTVAGAFEIAQLVADINKVKPIAAMADETMASAAFLIAAPAETIYAKRTSQVGSVGVVRLHVDQSQALSNEGYKVTVISSGEHKADGSPYEPLPGEVRDRLQAESDALRKEFAQVVAKGRGIDFDAVMNTEAAVYRGQTAKKHGFADVVTGSMPAALKHFGRRLSAINTQRNEMSKEQISEEKLIADARAEGYKEGFAKAKAEAEQSAEQQMSAAQEEAAKAVSEQVEQAKSAERERATSVMEAAKGKEELASKLLKTEMSAESIVDALAAVPAAQAPAAPAATGLSQGAGVGASSEDASATEEQQQESEAAAFAADMLERFKQKGLITGDK